jgi:RimJ/RimL family protein N-acetyltransferase
VQPELVILRDGSEIVIRQIEPDDERALQRGFEALSPESRYRRFLSPMNRLKPTQLRYLTQVDHRDHEALVAASVSDHDLVGVARYKRLQSEPSTAEVAVAVVDDWQGRAVASELLTRLTARAHTEAITHFRATCLAENREVLDLLEGLGPTDRQNIGSGAVALNIELAPKLEHEHPLRAILRHAGSGGLSFKHPLNDGEAEGPRSHAGPAP